MSTPGTYEYRVFLMPDARVYAHLHSFSVYGFLSVIKTPSRIDHYKCCQLWAEHLFPFLGLRYVSQFGRYLWSTFYVHATCKKKKKQGWKYGREKNPCHTGSLNMGYAIWV